MHTAPEEDSIANGPERNKFYLAMDYCCNNRCLFCVVDSGEKEKLSLSTEETICFINSVIATGEMDSIKFVELSGGEPTLRRDLFYIMDYIQFRYPEIRFGMLSNARLFCNPYLAERLTEFNMDWVHVPIHGDTAELHDMQTQVHGSFNEMVLGVHNLYAYRIKTSLKTVVSSLNYKKLPNIVEFVANEFPECRIFTICGIDVYGAAARNKESIAITFTDTVPYIRKAIDISKKYGLIVKIFSIPPCLFEKEYRMFVCTQTKDLLISKSPDRELKDFKYQYGTLDGCCGCILEKKCTGAWFTYFDEIGTHELKPIKEA